MEALLVAIGLLLICAVTFALTRVAAAGLRRSTGYFLTGVRPPTWRTSHPSSQPGWRSGRQPSWPVSGANRRRFPRS